MNISELAERAMQIRSLYKNKEHKKYKRSWNREDLMLGLVGDVGDLAKLVLAQEGIRDIENKDAKLKHELADCLWSLLVLSHEYGIDLEKEFLFTMDALKEKLQHD